MNGKSILIATMILSTILALLVIVLFVVNGNTIMDGFTSEIVDPTERGLMYIAISIVASAVIRACFNK